MGCWGQHGLLGLTGLPGLTGAAGAIKCCRGRQVLPGLLWLLGLNVIPASNASKSYFFSRRISTIGTRKLPGPIVLFFSFLTNTYQPMGNRHILKLYRPLSAFNEIRVFTGGRREYGLNIYVFHNLYFLYFYLFILFIIM